MAYQAVIDTIYTDRALYQDVRELLINQQNALLTKNTRILGELAGHITHLLRQAEDSCRQRSASLDTLGLTNTDDGMAQFFRRLLAGSSEATAQPQEGQDGATQLQAHWDELLALVQECKKINSVNGNLLELQQKATERTLERLRNRDRATPVYSSRGQTATADSSLLQIEV